MSIIVTYADREEPEERASVQNVAITIVTGVIGTPEDAAGDLRDSLLEYLLSQPDVVGQIAIGNRDDFLDVRFDEPPMGIEP